MIFAPASACETDGGAGTHRSSHNSAATVKSVILSERNTSFLPKGTLLPKKSTRAFSPQ